jgi:hypothetical protein
MTGGMPASSAPGVPASGDSPVVPAVSTSLPPAVAPAPALPADAPALAPAEDEFPVVLDPAEPPAAAAMFPEPAEA